MYICLLGPHGVGKTTLAKTLSHISGAAYREELGRVLRDEALARDPDATALRFDADFDRRVIEGDLQRDARAWPARCVLETWHPGNFGYARVRSPEVAALFECSARRHALALTARGLVVQPLTAHREVLRARLGEPGGTEDERLDFFRLVADEGVQVARSWGLRVLPALDTSDECPESIALRILKRTECDKPRRESRPVLSRRSVPHASASSHSPQPAASEAHNVR